MEIKQVKLHNNKPASNRLISINQASLFAEKSFPYFPSTRYQGSKRKILFELANLLQTLSFNSALDLYSGSGVVTLLLRHLGKHVDANDYQQFSQTTARLFLNLSNSTLSNDTHEGLLNELLSSSQTNHLSLVRDNYSDIFFTKVENTEIDCFCQNSSQLSLTLKDLYVYAVGQALMKKRPYNLFHRANLSMRQRDVKRSFGNAVTWETSILNHAIKAIEELKKFPFTNNLTNSNVFGENTSDLSRLPNDYDLVYLDPPYLNAKGIGIDYSDFYSFLEGIVDYSLFSQGDLKYPHKPIDKKCSRWAKSETALEELSDVLAKWKGSTFVLSYRSDGLPILDEMVEILSQNSRKVEVHTCGEYKYALSKTKNSHELFIISRP